MDTCCPRSCNIQTHWGWTWHPSIKTPEEQTTFLSRCLLPKILWIENTRCSVTFSKNVLTPDLTTDLYLNFYLILFILCVWKFCQDLNSSWVGFCLIGADKPCSGCFLYAWWFFAGSSHSLELCGNFWGLCWRNLPPAKICLLSTRHLGHHQSRQKLNQQHVVFLNMQVVWTQATNWHKNWPLTLRRDVLSSNQNQGKSDKFLLSLAFGGKMIFLIHPPLRVKFFMVPGFRESPIKLQHEPRALLLASLLPSSI